ncbi:hypothetical protein [Brevundimonas sp. NIBR11]|uniref:hypothetical protein n=1 Tax=Brevundimonas sp. NIBR11 TaxID=3015999 RepID=UPI0022EFDA70|nr:hypothetical protein [Brevundimonas sp. NIBR11]WGM31127.1 hypothetical protein KKHFBJBL_01367 [Brevundimonas sp. NIBR11]
MELRTTGGQLKPGRAFKLVATGYFLGAGVIFLPLFALVTVISLAAGVPPTLNGEPVGGNGAILVSILPLIMVPVILAIQAVMFGGLAVLGLWLYSKRKPIPIVEG